VTYASGGAADVWRQLSPRPFLPVAMGARPPEQQTETQHHHLCRNGEHSHRDPPRLEILKSTWNWYQSPTQLRHSHHHASRRGSCRRTLTYTPNNFPQQVLTLPAYRTVHIALQNRQRHRLPPTHFRLALDPLPIPHTTPAVPSVLSRPALAHPPNTQRKPQPHPLTA